jgi:hypothetical protein
MRCWANSGDDGIFSYPFLIAIFSWLLVTRYWFLNSKFLSRDEHEHVEVFKLHPHK